MISKKYFSKNYILLGALFLSACSNLPSHKSTLNDDAKIVFASEAFSLQGENKIANEWWLALNDPTLNKIINQALQSNNSLKAGLIKINQSRLALQSTEAGQAFTLNGTAGISNNSADKFGISSNVNSYSVGLSAAYELDLWGKLSNQADSSALDIKASLLDYKTLAISTSADVAIAWYRLIEQMQQLNLLDQQLFITEGYLQLLEQQFRSGQALAADVIQQRQSVESVKGDYFNSNRLLQKYKSQLALLLATPSFDFDLPVNLTVPNLPAMPALGLKAKVLNNRPDVQTAFNNLAKADLATAIAVARRYPSINLTASYNRNGSSLANIFDNWASSLAASLLIPILDGDATKLAVTQNELSYQQTFLAYQNTLLLSVKEVEDALFNEKQQLGYLQSLKKQRQYSAQATEQIRHSYINGALDFQRVLNAVISDQNLQRNYIKAKRELMEYRISLYRALSGGWDNTNQKEKSHHAK